MIVFGGAGRPVAGLRLAAAPIAIGKLQSGLAPGKRSWSLRPLEMHAEILLSLADARFCKHVSIRLPPYNHLPSRPASSCRQRPRVLHGPAFRTTALRPHPTPALPTPPSRPPARNAPRSPHAHGPPPYVRPSASDRATSPPHHPPPRPPAPPRSVQPASLAVHLLSLRRPSLPLAASARALRTPAPSRHQLVFHASHPAFVRGQL